MYFIKDPQWLIVSMVGLGVGCGEPADDAVCTSSAASVPYREDGRVYGHVQFLHCHPANPRRALLGLLVRTVFHGHAINAIVLGGVSMIAAAGLMMRVKDDKQKAA